MNKPWTFSTKERRAFSEITQSQYKKPKPLDLENKLMVTKGGKWRRDKLGG